jgi:uncharacterized protein YjiS (DUF1127 family)
VGISGGFCGNAGAITRLADWFFEELTEVVMPAITALSFSATAPIQRLLAAIWRQFTYRAKRLERSIEHRRAAQALVRFDDRMLADIGLTRADLRDAYAVSLWTDPTSLLRARALERRLARHGISHGLTSESPIAPPLAPKVDTLAASQARVTFARCH